MVGKLVAAAVFVVLGSIALAGTQVYTGNTVSVTGGSSGTVNAGGGPGPAPIGVFGPGLAPISPFGPYWYSWNPANEKYSRFDEQDGVSYEIDFNPNGTWTMKCATCGATKGSGTWQ